MVQASTRGGADASPLIHKLDRRLSSEDSLYTAARACLANIPSADKALRDLGMFAFVSLHLFSVGRRHPSAVTEILHLIEKLDELHAEVQGMISSPHLSTTLLYNYRRAPLVTVKRDYVNLWVGHVGRTPEVGVRSQALYSYS